MQNECHVDAPCFGVNQRHHDSLNRHVKVLYKSHLIDLNRVALQPGEVQLIWHRVPQDDA